MTLNYHHLLAVLLALCGLLPSAVGAEAPKLIVFDKRTSWADSGMRGLIFDDGTAFLSRGEPFIVWRVQLSKDERTYLDFLLRKYEFFSLPREISSQVTDGNDIDLGFCRGSTCHQVHEYMGEGPAAETVHLLYGRISSLLQANLSSASLPSPRQVKSVIQRTQGSSKDFAGLSEIFLRHLAPGSRPPYPDDWYVCLDRENMKAITNTEPLKGCRPQIVWDTPKAEERDGFVCRIGPMTFFTATPLNRLGSIGEIPKHRWCAEKHFRCKSEIRLIGRKTCAKHAMKDLADMNEVHDLSLTEGPCPPSTDISIESWTYDEPCKEEACYLEGKPSPLGRLIEIANYDELGPKTEQTFRPHRLSVPPELERDLTASGLYCTEISGESNGLPTLTKAALLFENIPPQTLPPPAPNIPVPLSCREDSDCARVGNVCAEQQLAQSIAAKSGQTISRTGCRCLRGPTVFGCVPAH